MKKLTQLLMTILLLVMSNQPSICESQEIVQSISLSSRTVMQSEMKSVFEIYKSLQEGMLTPIAPQKIETQHVLKITETSTIESYCGLDSFEINRMVANTGLEGLGDAYLTFEREYNINALVILSITILESSWGNSDLAVYKNNLSGYMAYDHDPFGSAYHFDTKEDAVESTFMLLREEYIDDGLDTLELIGERYASDIAWANKVVEIIRGLEGRLR